MNNEIQINHHPWTKMRLVWMQDNQPYALKDRYDKGILKDRVMEEVSQALWYKNHLISKGIHPENAEEIARELLTPADQIRLRGQSLVSNKLFQMMLLEVMD